MYCRIQTPRVTYQPRRRRFQMHSGVVSAATVERLAVIAAVQVGRAHAAPTVVVVAVAVADLSYAPNYIARDSWPSPWAREMAYQMEVESTGSVFGRVLMHAGVPVCRAIGSAVRTTAPAPTKIA